MKRTIQILILSITALLFVHCSNNSGYRNLAKNQTLVASSENTHYPATNAVDGHITRMSKWMTSAESQPPHTLDINFKKYCRIDKVVVHSGILEDEKTDVESVQASGFFAVKHFIIQYWDDSNWTDIPSCEITENRSSSAEVIFPKPVVTFKIRIVAMDGEALNVMEVEVFGEEVKGMPEAPLNEEVEQEITSRIPKGSLQKAKIVVNNNVIGKSFRYVGYNQAYYLPNSNISAWLEYAQVNSLRLWTSLTSYVPTDLVEIDSSLTQLKDFENRKARLRQSPEDNDYIQWEALNSRLSVDNFEGSNSMNLKYALNECQRLEITPLLQVNDRRFYDNWWHKWQQWQRFYALAYYAAKEGDVSLFAIQNEPNHRHSGPMEIETWLRGMRIASDAIRCAIADVNAKYDKSLVPQFVGPVTAGTNIDWWEEVIKNIRIDYRGEITNYDLIDVFSTHSYNSPAAGYSSRVNSIRKIIKENHPEGNEIPIVFTETGRWMNSYLIDKKETMDSPSLFTEWAGMYTNNMKNECYGMWAFKLASNTSSSYTRGIKSGHHAIWQGQRLVEDAWHNVAEQAQVNSTSTILQGELDDVTDGCVNDSSTCVFEPTVATKYLEIKLAKKEEIGSALIYTGSSYGVFTGPDRVKNFKLQYLSGDEWIDIKGAAEKNCKYVQVLLKFEKAVIAQQFRLVVEDQTEVKIREVKLYRANEGYEKAKTSYDISGVHRTGEVVRLFAKGFKNQRNLLATEVSAKHKGLDVACSYDEISGNYYVWLVQRAPFSYDFSIDLSSLKLPIGNPVFAETVGPDYYGEVSEITTLDDNLHCSIHLPAQSVVLLTIPAQELNHKSSLGSSSQVSVAGDDKKGVRKTLNIALDASSKAKNKLAYIHFDFPEGNSDVALLNVNGYVDSGDKTMQLHVYAYYTNKQIPDYLSWDKAPYLNKEEALIEKLGKDIFIVGQLSFDKTAKDHQLDISKFINKSKKGMTFILVRETRQMGDYADKGRTVILDSNKSQVLLFNK